jgi:hypothetical protein
MSGLYKESKIYVACSIKSNSGGAESLHQLVNHFKLLKKQAFIYYFDLLDDEKVRNNKFKEYNISYVKNIEDEKNNFIIVPETATELLYKFKNIRKAIWWLSVDFYLKSAYKYKSINLLQKYSLPTKLWPIGKLILNIKKGANKQFEFGKDKNKYIHFYNCEYGKEFLLKNGIHKDNTIYLCGPINKDFIINSNNNMEKEDIVAYNPKKGMEFTIKIIDKLNTYNSNIRFVAIKDMSTNEVSELLRKAKVYVDFGYFPGPERIPREAVLSYCNIITSNIGSSQNDVDIPIPREFKFSLNDNNIIDICKLIINQIDNYNDFVENYNLYRLKVIDQLNTFEINIENILSKYIEI